MRCRFFVVIGDCFGWAGTDGGRRMGWMRGCFTGWAFLDPARPLTPTFPSNYIPAFAYGTSGSGLLTRRIDFTARAVSSDTNGPNETADPTLPSFKSKGSVQKRRLNSTWERFAILPPFPFPQSADIESPLRYQRVAYVYKAKKERQGSKVRVIWGYVFPNFFL